MRFQFTGLWRDSDFMKLWIGETVSLLGSQITPFALPLVAILVLNATPDQMGILGAVEFAPFLLIGLFAGVWIDRRRRRPILIGADIARTLLLATIPIAAMLNALSMMQLYIVGFLVGIFTVFFDVSYQSYLPALVKREKLVEGNSKLEISRSVATIAGPGLAGQLVQLVTAPIAIAIDAVSFLVSAIFLSLIRVPEPDPVPHGERRSFWMEIREGLNVVLGNPLLRSIAGCTATANLFGSIMGAVLLLYLTRVLHIEPGLLGLIFSIGSIGALVGALYAGRAAQRFGVGPTIVGSALLGGLGSLFIPFAAGPLPVIAVLLIGAQFLMGLSGTIYNINQVSLRQTITPDRLQGRMNATMRFMVWGTMPIGSLIGGGMGTALSNSMGDGPGLQATLLIGAVGGVLAFLWVFMSPVRALWAHPEPAVPAPAGD